MSNDGPLALMQRPFVFNIKNLGARPPFYIVAEHLWGRGCNFDSDGNSETSEDPRWTELTVAPRGGGPSAQVAVYPVSVEPLVLAVRSPDELLSPRVRIVVASIEPRTRGR